MRARPAPDGAALLSLREQQLALQALILGHAQQRQEQEQDQELGQGGAEALLAGPGLSVYQEAYVARLLSALRDNYAVLHLAMGDEAFHALGCAYLAAKPSTQPSIRWFGDQLAAFMAGPFADRLQHPALVDLARMDWALRAAFDGADGLPLTLAALSAVAPEDWGHLRLRLQASAQLLHLDWSVEPSYLALRGREVGEVGEEREGPEPVALPHALLVWREGGESRWRSLEAWEAEWMEALQAQLSLAELCEQAAQTLGPEKAAVQVVQALRTWVQQGLLAA